MRVILVALVGLMALMAGDTIPDQDGCMTDIDCEMAWNAEGG
jgi:hypothetical protein